MNLDRRLSESEGYVVLSDPHILRNVSLWVGAAVVLVAVLGMTGAGIPWWATATVALINGCMWVGLEWLARGYVLAVNDSVILFRNGRLGKKVALSRVREVYPQERSDRRTQVRIGYRWPGGGLGNSSSGTSEWRRFRGFRGGHPTGFR